MFHEPALGIVRSLRPSAKEVRLPARTLYAACLSRLGLSQQDGAELHKVSPQTVRNWATGRRPVPQGAWDELRARDSEVQARIEALLRANEVTPFGDVPNDASALDDLDAIAASALVLSGALSVLPD